MDKGKLTYHEYPTGGFTTGYTDYDVECMGGSDYETKYTLDAENAEKLMQLIGRQPEESGKEALIRAFGEYMDKEPFGKFCDANGIKYDLFTWIS